MLLGVIALLVIGTAGVGAFLYSQSFSTQSQSTTESSSVSTSSQSTSGSASGPFKVNYDTLVVGYNSGLWEIQVQDISGKQVKQLTATLATPTQSMICTGLGGGFAFVNCPATPPSTGSFPLNATFTGYATGVGAGSATPGKSYTVTLNVVYVDGTTDSQIVSVTAESSA